MAYIGKEPANSFISFAKQDFSTSATTSYTLDNAVANENELALFINFVRQEPTTAYTASGTTLTLTSATASTDDMYCVYLGQAKQTVNPPDGSVSAAKLTSDSVTAAKLNDDIISGQTALASEPADTDEFLVSDAGTLKRIDYSLIKATSGLSMVDQWRLTADKTNVGTSNTVFDSNLEQIDTGGQTTVGTAMSESSGVFTFPATGKYLIIANTNFYRTSDIRFCKLQIDIGISGTYTQLAQGYGHIKVISSGATYSNVMCTTIVNIGNTSNDTVRFIGAGNAEVTAEGSTTTNRTTFTFIKLD